MDARLIAASIAVFAVFGTAAGAAPAQEVTLEVERIYEQQYGLFRLRFSGRISSGAANEYVAVLHQKCGFRFSTAIGGATTTEGGSWESIPRYGAPPQSGTFRALWRGHRSEPVTLRSPVRISLSKQAARRYRVTVNADSNLSGRFVALQRLAGGRWRHVRRVRLAPYGQAGYGGFYTAAFTVRKRGLRLRILVPEKTAAPCHEPAAVTDVRLLRRRPGVEGLAVIDGTGTVTHEPRLRATGPVPGTGRGSGGRVRRHAAGREQRKAYRFLLSSRKPSGRIAASVT